MLADRGARMDPSRQGTMEQRTTPSGPETDRTVDAPRKRRVTAPQIPTPDYDIRAVNESVPALPDWVNTNARLVRRITMGVTAGEMAQANLFGYQEYLNRQLHHMDIDDSAVDAFVTTK